MRKRTRFYTLIALALVAVLVLPATALAANRTIYTGKGVSGAKLGMKDSTAAKKIGKVVKKGVDKNYPGQTVYVFYFGKKSHGKYAVEMYSKKNHKVFAFVIRSSAYKTSKGIRVGSSEAALTAAYPTIVNQGGSVYTRYHLGGNPGTDFQVQNGKVKIIQIWKY